jgi:hypothetical protein
MLQLISAEPDWIPTRQDVAKTLQWLADFDVKDALVVWSPSDPSLPEPTVEDVVISLASRFEAARSCLGRAGLDDRLARESDTIHAIRLLRLAGDPTRRTHFLAAVHEIWTHPETWAAVTEQLRQIPGLLFDAHLVSRPSGLKRGKSPFHPYDEEPPPAKQHTYHPTTVACTVPCFVAAAVEVGIDPHLTVRRLGSLNANGTYWVRRGRGHDAIIHLPMTTRVATRIEYLVACIGRLQVEKKEKKRRTNQDIAKTRKRKS